MYINAIQYLTAHLLRKDMQIVAKVGNFGFHKTLPEAIVSDCCGGSMPGKSTGQHLQLLIPPFVHVGSPSVPISSGWILSIEDGYGLMGRWVGVGFFSASLPQPAFTILASFMSLDVFNHGSHG